MSDTKLKAYLSAAFGFNEWGRTYMEDVFVPRLEDAGIDIINPWTLTSDEEKSPIVGMPHGAERMAAEKQLRDTIARRNRIGIDTCNFMIAVLDGISLAPGIVAEMCYAVGKGKVVFAWHASLLRLQEERPPLNLPIEYFIEHSGGRVCTNFDGLIESAQRFRSLYVDGTSYSPSEEKRKEEHNRLIRIAKSWRLPG